MAEQEVPYASLDTPAVLVDMDKLEANIREMSQLAADAGVRLRPQIKVHESADIARMQIEMGAYAVEVSPLGQAEAMAEAGFNDLIVAHPTLYSNRKLETLKRLLTKPGLKLTIVVDMIEQAESVSRAGQEVGRSVPVLIKVDVNRPLGGFSRFGIPPGEPVLNLAKKLSLLPNIEFIGIYAHEVGAKPTQESVDKYAFEAATLMAETAKMLRSNGFKIEHVSVGGSPTIRSTCRYIKEGKFPEITEVHPGNFVIGDIVYMKNFGNTREVIAVTVLTSVMNTVHSNFAIVDAGYKTIGADSIIARREEQGFFWNGMPSFGYVQGRPDLWFGRMAAESGMLYYMDPAPEKKLHIGERLEIVPNNTTLVINIHDNMYGVRKGKIERVFPVTSRGQGN